MKKQVKFVVTALALVLVSLATNAQFKKTDRFVEGTASYTKSANKDADYSFNPTIGYFLTDKFAVGAFGGIGEISSQKTLTVGVLLRYYIMNVGNKFKVYSQSSFFTDKDNSTYSANANLGIGANYFVTKKLALSTSLADLVSCTDKGSSTFSIGFNGINNPLTAAKFGILYRF